MLCTQLREARANGQIISKQCDEAKVPHFIPFECMCFSDGVSLLDISDLSGASIRLACVSDLSNCYVFAENVGKYYLRIPLLSQQSSVSVHFDLK
jgi:hypothetical protein